MHYFLPVCCLSGTDYGKTFKCDFLSTAKQGRKYVWYRPRVCLFVCVSELSCFISRGIQNGWAFKLVVVSTGCAIAVDHTFIFFSKFSNEQVWYQQQESINLRAVSKWWNIWERGAKLALLTYWENAELRGIHVYSKINNCLATIQNYMFLERRKPLLSENV